MRRAATLGCFWVALAACTPAARDGERAQGDEGVLPVGGGEGEGDGDGDGDGDGEGEGEGESDGDGDGDGDGEGEGEGEPGTELNPGWIGGACSDSGDCDSGGWSAEARCETAGFPGGFCTQACTPSATGRFICPDLDVSADSDFTTSRCISDAQGDPRCAAECDFEKSETGCRPGYRCVLRTRHADDASIFPVCLPAGGQRWPGEPAPDNDVGAPCAEATDCAQLACLATPGGMCTKTMCDFAGCPDGARCSVLSDGTAACLPACSRDDQCRVGDGYACDNQGTCFAELADDDCASAWGAGGDGLSPCDAAPDDYVVVRKGARTLRLCERGHEVAAFSVGLGFDPVGDKEREGDGRTPEGVFFIPRLVPDSTYYKAFLISYPDDADAARGLGAGLITADERDDIVDAQASCAEPPQHTGLGGLVEIHGMGGDSDWTWGCVAVENEQVDVLYGALGVGDTIVILP